MAKAAVKAQWRGLVGAIAVTCAMGAVGMWSLGWLDKDVHTIGGDVLRGTRHYLGIDTLKPGAVPPPRAKPYGGNGAAPPSTRTSAGPAEDASPLDTMTQEHLARGATLGYLVVDEGDMVELNGQRLRLWGIDTPEMDQWCTRDGRPWSCGTEAAKALREHVAGNLVACYDKGVGDDDMVMAQCFLGHTDLNGWMARQGWAMAYRPVTTMYSSRESMAKFQRLGIWKDGGIEAPWQWRLSQGRRVSAN